MLKAFDFYEGNLKRIWTDGRNLMDSVTAEQVTFIHESLRYAEAEREFDDVCPPLRTLWPEVEAAYDLGLSKWNVFVNEAVTNHKVFRNYMEAWEKVKVNKKHEMFKLLEKYKRMVFFDKDEKNEDCDGLFMILSRNLEWFKRGRGTEAGWRVLAMPLSLLDDDGQVTAVNEGSIEAYAINRILHKMIAKVDQSQYGYKLVDIHGGVTNGGGSGSSSSDDDDDDSEGSDEDDDNDTSAPMSRMMRVD